MTDASHNEELLTALFDGQLSGAERDQAEKLLAESPEYQAMFEQWKQQARDLKSLPSHKLDDAFAFRVMREALKGKVTAETSSGGGSNWKAGLAVVAGLAAVILLALFVFPQVSNWMPIAGNTEAVDDADAKDSDSEEDRDEEWEEDDDEDDRSPPRQRSNRPLPGSDEFAEVKLGENDDAPDTAGNVPGNSSGDSTDTDTNAADQNPPTRPKTTPSGKPMRVPQRVGVGSLAGTPQTNDSTTDNPAESDANPPEQIAGVDGQNNQSPPIDQPRTGQQTDSQVAQGDPRPNAVDRVLLINMQHRDQPLAELQRVFARNSIEILNDRQSGPADGDTDSENADGQANRQAIRSGADGDANAFSKRSLSGMEAVYVVSTPAQMRKAISELADQALIAGYAVPGGQSEKSPAQSDSEDSSSGKENASAQQLQPYEFGSEKKVKLNSDGEIAELDNWFNLSASDPDNDLIQYLLFVRTDPEKE